jgi:hypothetical protein
MQKTKPTFLLAEPYDAMVAWHLAVAMANLTNFGEHFDLRSNWVLL